MGLGIAVDYGLFMVSRFREEIAEGYDTEAAVRRTVMTSGRTIMFSAVILVASSVPLLLFPQGFLKSITYAIIASVMLAAILSITVLAAALAHPRAERRRARRAHAAAGSVLPQLEADAGVPDLAGREDAEDQDPRRGREGLLGQAGQPRDEAACRVRRAHRHRDDPADHPAGAARARRHQREVPAAGQLGAPGAGGVRQDLPGLPHRAADDGDPERQRPTRHRPADRRGPQQGDGDLRVHRPRQRPGQDVAGTPVPRRRIEGSVDHGSSRTVW